MIIVTIKKDRSDTIEDSTRYLDLHLSTMCDMTNDAARDKCWTRDETKGGPYVVHESVSAMNHSPDGLRIS